jgi:hypothetical protein
MMPLCTTATVRAASVCGCALTSLGSPCVAHRVCAMPTVESTPASRVAASRFVTLPCFFITRIEGPLSVATINPTPEES